MLVTAGHPAWCMCSPMRLSPAPRISVGRVGGTVEAQVAVVSPEAEAEAAEAEAGAEAEAEAEGAAQSTGM